MDSIEREGQDLRRCVFRPRGVATAVELAQEIADVLFDACQGGAQEALLDITAVNGFESPGPLFRAWAVGLWSRAADNKLRIAMIARPEHISPEKVGLLVAAELGLQANIFDAEPLAIAWLDDLRAES